jgi:VIT1/CCC1 family predicted Fe2+/Mn2+ transporter
MTDEIREQRPAHPRTIDDYSPEWLRAHIEEERREASLLGDIRELIFGAQDGLVSTLAVVATVAGATSNRLSVLVAGLASAVAGVFSMGIGEYMSSKSQYEVQRMRIAEEAAEVEERPLESEAEVAFMFEEEGMSRQDARATAAIIARYPRSLLSTMVSKELGLIVEEQEVAGSPLRGALFMGSAFAAGGAVPIVPYLFTEGTQALVLSILATAGVLFGIGAIKSRWTHRRLWASGLEIVALAAVAGVAGYLFGTVLPTLLGFAGV